MNLDTIKRIISDPSKYTFEERRTAKDFISDLLDYSAEEDSNDYYHFVLIGNEGIDGYVVKSKDEITPEDTSSLINMMSLRARYNSQRKIKGFIFRCETTVDKEDICESLLENPKVIRFF